MISVNLTMVVSTTAGYAFVQCGEIRRAPRRSTTAVRDDLGPSQLGLKGLPCELECVEQLAWRFESNPFKLHAGIEFIRTMTFGRDQAGGRPDGHPPWRPPARHERRLRKGLCLQGLQGAPAAADGQERRLSALHR